MALFEHPSGFLVYRCLSHGGAVRLCPLCVPAYLWIALIALLGVVLLCCTTCLVSLVSCSTHIVWCVLSSVTFVHTVCVTVYFSVPLSSCCACISSFSLEFGLLRSLVLRGVTFLVFAFLFVSFAITLRCNTTVCINSRSVLHSSWS